MTIMPLIIKTNKINSDESLKILYLSSSVKFIGICGSSMDKDFKFFRYKGTNEK